MRSRSTLPNGVVQPVRYRPCLTASAAPPIVQQLHDLPRDAAGPESGPELRLVFQHRRSYAGQAQFSGQYQIGGPCAHYRLSRHALDYLGMHYLPLFTTPFAQVLFLASSSAVWPRAYRKPRVRYAWRVRRGGS